MRKKFLFYVQHLQGVGHVFRASRIVEALVAKGFAVNVAYGGEPIDGFTFPGAKVHYLPPVRAGGEVFNRLEDPAGNAVDDAYKEHRRDLLLALFDETAPDVVITEAFPFGRRQMRFELMPLLERARSNANPPLLVSSIRDILQHNAKPFKDRETVDILKAHFDRVLVHADPKLVRLEDSFPLAAEILDMVLYTGIVSPEPKSVDPAGENFDVVVSVGGGALGHELLTATAGAKGRSCLRDGKWLLITGPKISPEHEAELVTRLDDGITLRTFMPDLSSILARAQLSISRVGYNTVADIYRAGCRAIVVPFFDGIETEQVTRAALLKKRGLAEMVGHDEQTPEAVAAAIDRIMAAPPPDRGAIDLEGAANAAAILGRLVAGERIAGIA
ncbi:MAG: glycosyl transferase [Rhizobiaceae bacterium]|nr:MAG: glycosyl transferase [Rhizobiaceae bacterium]